MKVERVYTRERLGHMISRMTVRAPACLHFEFKHFRFFAVKKKRKKGRSSL